MAKSEKKDKKADKTKGTTSKVQKTPQVVTKTPITSTEILAKATDKGKAIAKPTKKKESKEAKPLPTTDANGKSKTRPKDANSSEESTESSSEDEKPKAAQVKSAQVKVGSTSDSSDSDSSNDERQKTKITPSTIPKARPKHSVAKTTPVKLEQSKVAESESDSSEESDSEEPVKGSKSTPAKIEKKSESSSDESSSSDEESGIPVKKGPLAAVSKSSSEESDSDEEPKTKVGSTKAAPMITVSSSDDSEKDIKAESSSDESSEEDEDGDAKMADARAPAPTSGKRKAAEDAPVPSKKVKVADGHAASVEENKTGATKTIFVGRLSWAVDSDRLAEEFASFGEVVSANVQVDRNTGKSRGFGFVNFTTAEAAEKALTMNGQEIDGRPVNVDLSAELDKSQAKEKRAKAFGDTTSPPSTTLFVGNLSFNTTEDAVWTFFDNYSVKSVRLPTERETGRMKGFGYVEFEDVESAKKALEESKDAEIDGRSIRLDFSQPRDGPGGGGRFDRGGGGGHFDRGGGGRFDRGGRGQSRGRGRGGDRGGDRGWRGRGGGRGAPRGNPRSGGIASYEGRKTTF
ncbi:hypothetical protein M378DRAFT_191130 [Amanita muscaria Koide BX008]|uniref:RRM domain-containing protein n=1 Tax=Amanita muscaria (strain Koide BX008) TaxID=946122 RepID=A0A0C2XGR3_AMAMK|nr:hypothetical protein M378DRAFT_191130 [Amanita muscaria Koide BX008]